MEGRLVAIVGPSGVGKDSVMQGIAERAPKFELVRRTITRRAHAGGEDFEHVDESEFDRRLKEGAFCLHWRAHGLGYGIPQLVRTDVAGRAWRLVNLSRSVLATAAALFPNFTVIVLSAHPETLAGRLAGRGRESAEDVAQRLARDGPQIPEGIDRIDLSNDGPLEETVAAALMALQVPERA